MGLPITIFSLGIPEAMIYLTAVLVKYPLDLTKSVSYES